MIVGNAASMEADELLFAKEQLQELKAQWQCHNDARMALSLFLADSGQQSALGSDDSEQLLLQEQMATLEVNSADAVPTSPGVACSETSFKYSCTCGRLRGCRGMVFTQPMCWSPAAVHWQLTPCRTWHMRANECNLPRMVTVIVCYQLLARILPFLQTFPAAGLRSQPGGPESCQSAG